MKPSLRQVLTESHIAAVAIAVLLVDSAACVLQLLWLPATEGIGDWSKYAAADFSDASYFFRYFGFHGFMQPIYLLSSTAIGYFAAAWILSQVVYKVGPFRALIAHRARLTRNRHA